jgi:hypothetical protein
LWIACRFIHSSCLIAVGLKVHGGHWRRFSLRVNLWARALTKLASFFHELLI